MSGERAGPVGREAELATLEDALRAGGPRTVVLEGEAGIGKTTLWSEALRRVEQAGPAVLSARPVESEAALAFAALGDLLGDPLDALGERLPPPQRRALAVALLREEPRPGAPHVDPRAVGLAVLGLVRLLAAERRLVIAIDDLQWLDRPSLDALAFALRRVEKEPVTALLARRTDAPEPEVVLGRAPLVRVAVGPLSLGALGHLLRLELGVAVRRPTLQRIRSVSGGNPLYALELGRFFLRDGEPEPGEEIVLPRSLEALVEARLHGLPEPALEALWVAGALEEPLVPLLDRALEAPARELLAPAVAAGVVAFDGERLDFAHPLLRSASISLRSPGERARLHARLAELVGGVEERGRHLALAGGGPDEPTAAAIEQAAAAAAARGAALAATDLAERSLLATPDRRGNDARRRGVLAAETAWAAGDYDRGRKILEQLLDDAPSGRETAELLLRLVRQPRDVAETVELCTRGLAAANGDPGLAAELLTFRALVHYASGSVERASEDAAASLEAATSSGNRRRILTARALVELTRFFRGRPVDPAVLEAAAEEELEGGRPERYGPTYWLLLVLAWLDELDAARAWSERYLKRAEHLGHAYRGELLNGHATIEYRAGRLDRALECLREGADLQADFGAVQMEATTLEGLGTVLAAQGRVEEARAALERGRELAASASDAHGELRYEWASCLLELSRGDVAAAARHGTAAVALRRSGAGPAEDATPAFRDAAEALVATGRLEEAAELVGELEAAAAEVPRPRRVVSASRSRALLEAARGDLDAADRAIAAAVAELPRFPVPLEAARTHLAAGRIARRQRRRREAREHVTRAADAFARIGARLWIERAREELERLGGRAASGTGLTASEQRVAALAGEGLSTKEIASALVVSPKTVEGHLTHVYEKLGVRSRAALAHRLVGGGGG